MSEKNNYTTHNVLVRSQMNEMWPYIHTRTQILPAQITKNNGKKKSAFHTYSSAYQSIANVQCMHCPYFISEHQELDVIFGKQCWEDPSQYYNQKRNEPLCVQIRLEMMKMLLIYEITKKLHVQRQTWSACDFRWKIQRIFRLYVSRIVHSRVFLVLLTRLNLYISILKEKSTKFVRLLQFGFSFNWWKVLVLQVTIYFESYRPHFQ